MKIKLLLLILINFNSLNVSSQTDLIWSDEVVSNFDYGYSSKDYPRVTVENNVIEVLSLSDTNNDNKLQQIKYSLNGELLSTKLYGVDPTENDRIKGYKFDNSNNLYLLKNIYQQDEVVTSVIQKFDINADLIWEEEIVLNENLSFIESSIEILNNNQIFIALYGEESFTGITEQLVVSYNSEGTFLWQLDLPEIEFFTSDIKAYDNNVIIFGFNTYPYHSMITIEPDGTKTVVGNIEFIRGLHDIYINENLYIFASHGSLYWLTKLDSTGGVVWSTLYGDEIQGLGLERINAFIQDDEGNIFVTGHFPGNDTEDSNDIYLDFLTLKLNSEGEILWENRYHQVIDSGEQAYDLKLNNGYIYVCGESSNNGIGTHHDFAVIKMNALNGEMTAQYRYDNGGKEDCFYSMEILSNDEIILTGFTSEEFGSSVNLITQKLSGISGSLSVLEPIKDNFSLYPNPINNNEILKIQNKHFTNYSIFTLNGLEIKTGKLNIEGNSEIYLDNFSSGLYLLILKSDTATLTKKIIIN